MGEDFPEPMRPFPSRAAVLIAYLDHFRAQVVERVEAMADDDRRRSRAPSGWTPLELVRHLTHVERRWLEWGFEGRPGPEPVRAGPAARASARATPARGPTPPARSRPARG